MPHSTAVCASLSSDVTLELLVGNHHLDSQLQVSSINSFTMRANTSATVMCNQQHSGVSFYFHHMHQIQISGITFTGSCTMFLKYVTNATFEKNSLHFVSGTRCCPSALAVSYSSVLMRLCSLFNSGRYYGGAINSDRSNFIIEQSTIKIEYYSRSNTYGGAIYLQDGNIYSTVTSVAI